MFARFRESPRRLQVSVVETRRVEGKVRHEHVASLGSIGLPLSVPDRIEFWLRLHERLMRLSNRIDGSTQIKVLDAIHARIPMVTPDEQRALQIENAEADARLWGSLHDMHQEQVEGHKGLAGKVERTIAENEKATAQARERRDTAQNRLERLKNGENVQGGIHKPITREDLDRILREAGMTTADIRHCETLGEFSRLVGEDGFEEFLQEHHKRKRRTEHARDYAAMRVVLRRRTV
jgi:hypothetical protein